MAIAFVTWSALVRAVRLALPILLFLFATAAASAAGLFAPVSESEVRSVADAKSGRATAPQAVRHRLVRVDAGELEQHVVPANVDQAANRLDLAGGLDGVIQMELFPDVVATFRRRDVSALAEGGYAWVGDAEGRAFSGATLIITNGQITGHVQLEHRLFRIDPVDRQVHRITELDPRKFPKERMKEAPVSNPDMRSEQPEPKQDAEARATSTIRVLVVYTESARAQAVNQSANIQDEIRLAVSLANTGFTNVGVRARFVLARMVRIVYAEGNDFERNLDHLTTGSQFARIRRLRNSTGADLVVLVRKSSRSLCGIGWYIETPSGATDQWGFSVVSRECIMNHSFAHETGHNMGLRHDRFVESPAPPTEYNFGYNNCRARLRTIMAYADFCLARCPEFCTRVNYFSSATRKGPDGAKIGIPAGTRGAADNARRLNRTRTAVSRYRGASGDEMADLRE
jgi:hypothetical protein